MYLSWNHVQIELNSLLCFHKVGAKLVFLACVLETPHLTETNLLKYANSTKSFSISPSQLLHFKMTRFQLILQKFMLK